MACAIPYFLLCIACANLKPVVFGGLRIWRHAKSRCFGSNTKFTHRCGAPGKTRHNAGSRRIQFDDFGLYWRFHAFDQGMLLRERVHTCKTLCRNLDCRND